MFRRFFAVILVFLLSGCNYPLMNPTSPAPESVIQTSAAKTVEVMGTSMAATLEASLPQGTSTSTPVVPTMPLFTATLLATITLAPFSPSPTATPSITPATECDRAVFVNETIPDETVFNPGQRFVKTWILRNAGSCTWKTGYKLVYVSGNALGAPESVALPEIVEPGQDVAISVNLKAPDIIGSYKGYWALKNAQGERFGLGPMADRTIYVQILVGAVPQEFAVTGAKMTVYPKDYSGKCPVKVTFTVELITNAAGTVVYQWLRGDGTRSKKQSIVFYEAGTQYITDDWKVGAPGDDLSDWEAIYIDEPNHQTFAPVKFFYDCDSE